jgi:methyl-accepting chemotaxis protein
MGAAEALEDALNVLPVARRVVGAVPAKTEEATMALITRFEGVRELSSRAAAASKEALSHIEGGDSSASFQTRAVQTKEAIEAERKAVSGIVANNRENARKLQAMSKDLESGIQLIQGIEEITERSRLIAFNMAVEAAHIGEKGRGFKVIVNELRSLNDRTVDFSRQVRDLLGRYREYNAALVAGMAEHSERLSGEVLDVMRNAGGAVESLIESAATTQDLSTRLAGLVVEMDRDLDGVLEALQFQDVTRQMLEGAMAIIADAEERLGRTAPLLAGLGERDQREAAARLEAIRGAYIARAKTKDEKTAIMEVRP